MEYNEVACVHVTTKECIQNDTDDMQRNASSIRIQVHVIHCHVIMQRSG